MTDEQGVPLARLFAIGYRHMVGNMHQRLRARGWREVRPAYGFALLAARDRGTTITDLAVLMGMTKQAASKLAAAMIAGGYLDQRVDRGDARVRPLRLTPRGRRLLAVVEEIYADLEREWADAIGEGPVETMRNDLTRAIRASNDGVLPAVRPTW